MKFAAVFIVALCLCFCACVNISTATFAINLISTSDGDHAIITFDDGKTALILNGEGGQDEILYSLNHNGITLIDYLILPAFDGAHTLLAKKIIDKYAVKSCYVPLVSLSDNASLEFRDSLSSKNVNIYAVINVTQISGDRYSISLLPSSHVTTDNGIIGNPLSIVIYRRSESFVFIYGGLDEQKLCLDFLSTTSLNYTNKLLKLTSDFNVAFNLLQTLKPKAVYFPFSNKVIKEDTVKDIYFVNVDANILTGRYTIKYEI